MRPLEARLPQLRRWARRYATAGTSPDDLVAWAALGVLEAGVEHDRRFGPRARGAMLDALRRERGPRASVAEVEALEAPPWDEGRWEARRVLWRLASGWAGLDPEAQAWLSEAIGGETKTGPRTASGRRKRDRRIRSRLRQACGAVA
jgi:hypothetical protein